ncbi:MAG: ferritin-like domain-containing protein [Phycisphaeraceae bacterium]
MTRKDMLISWLNDAYATEQSLINVLEKHAEHAKGHTEIKKRYDAHLAQTRKHAEMVEQCLQNLGSDASSGKKVLGKMTGWMQGLSSAPAGDTLVKDALADYSMEHFEIASYRGLIVGAEEAGESEVAETCRQILAEEEEMAAFLEQQIPRITQSELSRQTES